MSTDVLHLIGECKDRGLSVATRIVPAVHATETIVIMGEGVGDPLELPANSNLCIIKIILIPCNLL